MSQSYAGTLEIQGYAKNLPSESSEKFIIKINELATDEFNDCRSTGAHDMANMASDLLELGLAPVYKSRSNQMTLFGDDSVLGKSIVVYALPEELVN